MSIEVVDGDIFESECEALVNPTNVDPGFMGTLAGLFSRRFMGLERDYVSHVQETKMKVGEIYVWPVKNGGDHLFILNMATCQTLGGYSELAFIERGLKALTYVVKEHKIQSVAIPALGSGVGGLRWDDVRNRIEKWYQDECPKDVVVKVYNPLVRR